MTINIRVYGILINGQREVLVSDELIRGHRFTKFPGGGLEFGEGTRDCLKREFMEEMNLEVAVEKHIYTTDFFQISAFNKGHQIISIYYFVRPLAPITVALRTRPFDFGPAEMDTYERTGETEAFRFIPWQHFSADMLSLPIDKIVAGMLKSSNGSDGFGTV